MTYKILSVSLLLSSVLLIAGTDDVVKIAPAKADANLKAAIDRIEAYAISNDFPRAASLVDSLKTNAAVANTCTETGEPLSLALAGAHTWYRLLSGDKSGSLKKEAEKLLDRYAQAANGKRFRGYELLIIGVRDCHRHVNNYQAAWELEEKLLAYNPENEEELAFSVDFCLNNPALLPKACAFFNNQYGKDISIYPEVEFLCLCGEFNEGNGECARKIVEWLLKNGYSGSDAESAALSCLDTTLDCSKPGYLRDVCFALTDLAINCRKNNRQKAVSFLTEREKIRAVAGKELVKAKADSKTSLSTVRMASFLSDAKLLDGEVDCQAVSNAIASNDESELLSCLQTCFWSEANKVLSIDGRLTVAANETVPYSEAASHAAYMWSSESAQRGNLGLSIGSLSGSLEKLAELKERIKNRDDSLADIARYRNLLLIPGVAGELYWLVERLFWTSQYAKAKEGFEFFLLPENPDGFTAGASRFYLGRMIVENRRFSLWSGSDEDIWLIGLEHLLSVHKYPTCLTYIAFSYLMAAKGYAKLKLYPQANALNMIEVPTMDVNTMRYFRHNNGESFSFYSHDPTNCIRHVQAKMKYSHNQPGEHERWFVETSISWGGEGLWEYCLSNGFTSADTELAIEKALECTNDYPFIEEFVEAVSHRWPLYEELPDSIRTNRVLNNNVFSGSNSWSKALEQAKEDAAEYRERQKLRKRFATPGSSGQQHIINNFKGDHEQ